MFSYKHGFVQCASCVAVVRDVRRNNGAIALVSNLQVCSIFKFNISKCDNSIMKYNLTSVEKNTCFQHSFPR